MRATATLQRETFSTSRLLEFFSEEELNLQIGFDRDKWAIALLKELIDNALDACEMAGVQPVIEVTIEGEGDSVSVRDNGPGLPADLLQRSLDYSIRVSDKSYYVSPSRGQLGNALKCLWAAPYVITGDRGEIEVHANGREHRITVELDRIAQAPRIGHNETDSIVKTGTFIKFGWPDIACTSDGFGSDFYNAAKKLLNAYSAFNPHATFKLYTEDTIAEWHAGAGDFLKWSPNEPTSALWYDLDRFISLIAAYLTKGRADGGRTRTVREFVGEFRGFKGSAKQKAVTAAAGLSGLTLRDLVENGEVSRQIAARLFTTMQMESQPVKPAKLGAVGREHLLAHLVAHASVEMETFDYKRIECESDGVPFVVETAFGVYDAARFSRRMLEILGLNWSPCLRSPFEGLTRLLGEARVDAHDPVVFVAHLTSPRLSFVDRGKSALQVTYEMREAFEKCVRAVTKEWKKLKRQADREDRISQRQRAEYMQRSKPKKITVKDAAYQAMRDAYLKASGGGKLPAHARQIMYAARGPVIELTGNPTPWKKSATFTQKLLIDYMEEHPAGTKDWDVVFDARGHFLEPHTGRRIDLGTLDVRSYIKQWHDAEAQSEEDITLSHKFATCGPANRFRFALFVEKEGFNPLFKAIQLTERFDLALMSTKGMSVTAARLLVDDLSKCGVTVLVLRDFDKAGFSIIHTLANDTRRYKFSVKPRVIDLGLRLEDVRAHSLESEAVEYKSDPRPNLKERGATDEEIALLVTGKDGGRWIGERVEINAMPSDVMVEWLEQKLTDAGAKKIIPSADTLAEAWKQATRRAKVQVAIDAALEEAKQTDEPMPAELADRIGEAIEGKSESWDLALWRLALDRTREK